MARTHPSGVATDTDRGQDVSYTAPMTFPRAALHGLALLPLISGCMADPATHLEKQLEQLSSHAEIGQRPIVRLAVAPPRADSRRLPGEHEVLKEWAKQIETEELVKSAIVLSPKIYDACKGEKATDETLATECELREAVRAATSASADALVLARTGYFVPPTALFIPYIPRKSAEVVTCGALYAIDAGEASMLRYERASVDLGATKLSEQRVRSIQGFLKAVSNSLVENADEFRYLHGQKTAEARGETSVEVKPEDGD